MSRKHNKLNAMEPMVLAVTKLGHDGRGIAHREDGKLVFVDGALPGEQVVVKLTNLHKKYDEGHHIQFFSSRGTKSKIDWFKFTLDQLDDWGVKYHSVKLGKPDNDLFIDDKGINNEEWYKIEGLSK